MKVDKNLEIVTGLNPIDAIIKKRPNSVFELYILSSKSNVRIKKLTDLAESKKIKTSFLNKEFFLKNFPKQVHQGVAILCKKRLEEKEPFLYEVMKRKKKKLFLVLDHVTDPHNVGACLRNASAAGVDAVIVPKNRACHLTAAARKVSCGGSELIPFVVVVNLVRTINFLKQNGVKVLGADKSSKSSYDDTNLSGDVAFVIGSEERGLKLLTAKNCENLISIPMPGEIESLNLSVSSGILLFEYLRQNNKSKEENLIN